MASENEVICNKEGCTLALTGKCVLDNVPKECPDRLESLFQINGSINLSQTQETLAAPIALESFRGSHVLTFEQMDSLVRQRYCQTIGILGVPNSGKTACLVSFYLMIAHDKLTGYEFRDSKTLMAFEEIASGAKKWGEKQPEQFTVHTEILDDRSAGFLHIKLYSQKHKRDVDFLLPDVPGEWSTSFIDSDQTDRLGYLKSTETILLMVNGQDISDTQTRLQTLHRISLLVQRLSAYLGDLKPKLIVVITHRDRCDDVKSKFNKIKDLATKEGFELEFAEIASFSDNDDYVAGSGISSLIDTILKEKTVEGSGFWPNIEDSETKRQILKYNRNQNSI